MRSSLIAIAEYVDVLKVCIEHGLRHCFAGNGQVTDLDGSVNKGVWSHGKYQRTGEL